MGTLHQVAVMAVVAGGLSLILGFRDLARRLVGAGVITVVVLALASGIFIHPTGAQSDRFPTVILGGALVVIGAVVLIVGWVRFTNRRRRMESWLGDRPTSRKKRIERAS